MLNKPDKKEDMLAIRELASRIQSTSGVLVASFSDCKRLEVQLNQSGIMISAHTLARFFGVLQSSHKPYAATLNLLASYIGYPSYQHFKRTINDHYQCLLEHPNDLFDTGSYALTAFELCLHNSDIGGLRTLLEAWTCKDNHSAWELRNLLGCAVRASPQRQVLLQTLAETHNGRLLYYEGFVDEDDADDHYSNALELWYAQRASARENKVFLAGFLTTRDVYSGKQPHPWCIQLLRDTGLQELHFHLVSRCIEAQILLEGSGQNRPHAVDDWVSTALQAMQGAGEVEQQWILARTLRALAWTGHLKRALQRPELRDQVLTQYIQADPKYMLTPNLIIQLVVHAALQAQQVDITPPYVGDRRMISETNIRIALEAATASLYAKGANLRLIQRNLGPFLEKTRNRWIQQVLPQDS